MQSSNGLFVARTDMLSRCADSGPHNGACNRKVTPSFARCDDTVIGCLHGCFWRQVNRKLRKSLDRRAKAVRRRQRHDNRQQAAAAAGGGGGDDGGDSGVVSGGVDSGSTEGKLPVLVQLTAAQANQLLLASRAMQKAAAAVGGPERAANPLFCRRPTPPAAEPPGSGKSAATYSSQLLRARSARPHVQRQPVAPATKRSAAATARRAASAGVAATAAAGGRGFGAAAVPVLTPRRKKGQHANVPTAAEVAALAETVAQRRPELSERPLLVFAVEGALADGCSCPCYFTASGGYKSATVHLRPGLASDDNQAQSVGGGGGGAGRLPLFPFWTRCCPPPPKGCSNLLALAGHPLQASGLLTLLRYFQVMLRSRHTLTVGGGGGGGGAEPRLAASVASVGPPPC